ncbi:unnamed protein product [Vitrella brassicaformis CCMP3155]|uniref:F-box domain-containing protein n=1 Tax=Vitrella brassicaformis (strain CCMP3155) TaxID=1169540 RepID=A0A0G4FY05_VITBC|nr:unnamed protein product [Vitrella brassicaformis CCMP3155]|eukprot:CEM20215.1 unnamed protein product [Vitrella brassicaformis CCMP3155]
MLIPPGALAQAVADRPHLVDVMPDMSWLWRPRRRRSSYGRVKDDAELSVVVTGSNAAAVDEENVLPLILPHLPVDELVRARAVSKAYGTDLVDEAAFLRRIDSSLAQQKLTGLIDVERHRTIDLPEPLSRLHYLSRCAYVLEQAGPRMNALIRLASGSQMIDQLPLVLTAESVLALVPDKETFNQLPAAMAIYKAIGPLLCREDRENGTTTTMALQTGERESVELHPSGCARGCTNFIFVISYILVIMIGSPALAVILDPDPDPQMQQLTLEDRCLVLLFVLVAWTLCFSVCIAACACEDWYTARRPVLCGTINGLRFRTAFKEELSRGHPYLKTFSESDPLVVSQSRTHPSFSSFALYALMTVAAEQLTKVVDAELERERYLPHDTLTDTSAAEEDVIVIEWRKDGLETSATDCKRAVVVVLLNEGGDGAAVASGPRAPEDTLDGHHTP